MVKMSLVKARKIAAVLARADMAFYILPALMMLLTAGTIAQLPLGLYAAQKIFFNSFIIWVGFIPLPGGYTLIGLLAFSLLIKFLLYSEWSLRKTGINITHLGVLILLFGGLLTALKAKESFMVIPEGSTSNYLYNYHQRTLYIFEDNALKQAIPFSRLSLRITGIPFELNVLNTCANCNIQKRQEEGNYKGMAQFMALHDMPSSKESEADISGLTFRVAGLKEQDGTYIAFEGMPEPIILNTKNHEYKIIFGKQQSILPFGINLIDFQKETYPGTDKARAYRSEVMVIDNGVEWPARIEMNKPLRYKGYTFYQSSFEQLDTMQATILSVVQNQGRLFPYLGVTVLIFGLLTHIYIVLRKR